MVAGMNNVLISVSSLAQRAKSVGIHKCNGASDGHIYRMFLYESALLILHFFIVRDSPVIHF